jgi:hypothetical protein
MDIPHSPGIEKDMNVTVRKQARQVFVADLSVLTQFLKMDWYRTFGRCAGAILDLVHWI